MTDQSRIHRAGHPPEVRVCAGFGPIGACILVLFASLCFSATTEEPAVAPLQSVPFLPDSIDLIERFPVARAASDDTISSSIPIDSIQRFAGGWYQASKTDDGQMFRWMGPRAGLVDIAMVESEALTLRMGMTAPRGENLPTLRVQFFWNGTRLGSADLTALAQTVVTQVPREATRPGMNRLEIYPSFWVNPGRLAGGARTGSNISLNLFEFKIERESAAPPRIPGAVPSLAKDGRVHQPAGSVVSYGVRIAADSRLAISGEWTDDQKGTTSEVLVILRGSDGETHEITRFASPKSGEPPHVERDIDLSAFAGKFAEVSTIVRQQEPGVSPRAFEWTHLILGRRAPAVTPPATRTTAESERPNIVLVLFDTLRADFTQPYGGSVSTPNFVNFAANGVTFANASASTSWTRSSVATMLSSLHEPRHSIKTIADRLPKSVPYLPELLRADGYNTIAISMNGHIKREWGFDRGFNTFHELGTERYSLLERNPTAGGYVNAWWDSYVTPAVKAPAPFFLFIHEIDPHAPYTPVPPFDAMYPSAYNGRPDVAAGNINFVRTGLIELSPEDRLYMQSQYKGEVSFVDAVLGAIIARLNRDGLMSNTLIIVTSDHGEEFGEHGGIGHMVTLYEEMLRIPMWWSWPGRLLKGRQDDSDFGSIDLAPTLLGLLGAAVPDAMEGRNLSARLRSPAAPAPFPMLAHLESNPDTALRSIRWDGWKLCEQDFGDQSDYALYHLATDPSEVTNQWTSQREIGEALRQLLDWYGHSIEGKAATMDRVDLETISPEVREQLQGLGYAH